MKNKDEFSDLEMKRIENESMGKDLARMVTNKAMKKVKKEDKKYKISREKKREELKTGIEKTRLGNELERYNKLKGL